MYLYKRCITGAREVGRHGAGHDGELPQLRPLAPGAPVPFAHGGAAQGGEGALGISYSSIVYSIV